MKAESARSRDVVARIEAFNSGRDPERLALKYRAMTQSPFAFFRGTAHLFWEDLARADAGLPDSPLVWACGDLHLDNFGSFRGDNGLAYFDLNDFDESALGYVAWEVSRFVTSVYVAASTFRVSRTDAHELVRLFLNAYQTALTDGKARWVERTTATGLVRTLLRRVSGRTRATLIAERTRIRKGKLVIRRNRRTLPATTAQRREVSRRLAEFARGQPDPKFFKVLDVARRASGLGSLGVDRYVILVRGEGADDRAMLDAKQATPSSLARLDRVPQPKWKTEAHRVVAIQRRMQAISPALLHPESVGRRGYVLREIQPTNDRLRIEDAKEKWREVPSTAVVMGEVTAWAQLRSSGRDGSATADDLIAFATADSWKKPLIDYARRYAKQVERDHQMFVDARKKDS